MSQIETTPEHLNLEKTEEEIDEELMKMDGEEAVPTTSTTNDQSSQPENRQATNEIQMQENEEQAPELQSFEELTQRQFKSLRDGFLSNQLDRRSVMITANIEPDYDYVSDETNVQTARDLCEQIKKARFSAVRSTINRLISEKRSLPFINSLRELFDSDTVLYNSHNICGLHVPLRVFAHGYRQTNFVILVSSPIQSIMYLGVPAPTDKVSPDLTGMSLYPKINGHNLKMMRKFLVLQGLRVCKIQGNFFSGRYYNRNYRYY